MLLVACMHRASPATGANWAVYKVMTPTAASERCASEPGASPSRERGVRSRALKATT